MAKLKDTPPAPTPVPMSIVAQVRDGIVDTIRLMPTSVIAKIAESEARSGHPFIMKSVDISSMKRADGTPIQVLDVYDVASNTFTAPK